MQSFETHAVSMAVQYRVVVQAPEADVQRLIGVICSITPLTLGAYDQNLFIDAPGVEHYRPREGAAAGVEDTARQRPGVRQISFQIERNDQLLASIVEAVFQAHSYQEPMIAVQEVLASRSKGLDDSSNPNRWWNTTGDWKQRG